MWYRIHLKYSVRYLFCFSCSRLLFRTSSCSAKILYVSFKLQYTTHRGHTSIHLTFLHNPPYQHYSTTWSKSNLAYNGTSAEAMFQGEFVVCWTYIHCLHFIHTYCKLRFIKGPQTFNNRNYVSFSNCKPKRTDYGIFPQLHIAWCFPNKGEQSVANTTKPESHQERFTFHRLLPLNVLDIVSILLL